MQLRQVNLRRADICRLLSGQVAFSKMGVGGLVREASRIEIWVLIRFWAAYVCVDICVSCWFSQLLIICQKLEKQVHF